MNFRIARTINIILGVWLVVSGFLWAHTSPQQNNAWVVGSLAVLFAALALAAPAMRWLNALLAAWLFISAWALPHVSSATVWNSIVVALIAFAVSLVGAGRPFSSRSPPASMV